MQQDDTDFVSAINSLTSLLKEKKCDASFEDYYIKAKVKCQEQQISEQDFPPLKCRQISTRIDNVPHTQHQFQTSKNQYKVEVYFDVLDVMLNNSLQRRFDKAACCVERHYTQLILQVTALIGLLS